VEKYSATIYGKHDNIIQRMRFACSIDKARDIHSEYVEHIAFSLQKYLRNCATILRLYVHFLSFIVFVFSKCAVDLH